MTITPSFLLWLLAGFSILHILEEFVYPGGFYGEYKKLMKAIGLSAAPAEMIIINSLFLGGVSLAVITGMNTPLFGLSFIVLVLVNGLLHTIQSIHKKRYFPGLYTALFLYIPLGILSLIVFPVTIGQKFTALTLGVGLHTIPFIVLSIKKLFPKRKKTVIS